MHNNIPDSMFYHHGLHMFAGHLLFTILFLIISSFLLMWVAVVWMEKTITHSTPDIRFDSRFVTAMLIDILLGLIIIIPISGLILMGGESGFRRHIWRHHKYSDRYRYHCVADILYPV